MELSVSKKHLVLIVALLAVLAIATIVSLVSTETVVFPLLVANSQAPSNAPSDSPSFVPSSFPSDSPSDVPSITPTARPSCQPSLRPSISMHPSISFAPSVSSVPSRAPTTVPSISSMPSPVPLDSDFDFNLKVYWEEGFMWQEDPNEKKWCMECCSCRTLNFRDDGSGNCTAVDRCREGHQLWVKNCDSGAVDFVVIYENSYIMLQVKERDVCMERVQQRYLVLEECDPSNPKQLWLNTVSTASRFSITPAYPRDDDGGIPYCVTQQHHPKSEEVVGLQDCKQAYSYTVGRWETY